MGTDIATRTLEMFKILDEHSPQSIDFLEWANPFELLISAVLSAQTTDKQVNLVVPQLFKRFPDAQSLANANMADVMEIIHSTGFYRVKAANIIELSRQLVMHFNGQVPTAMESLVTLPGVGRKCANVVLGRLGNAPAIIVDTHFGRVVRRVGLTTVKNPTMVERQIGSLLPSELHYRFSMIVNLHGRTTCQARKAFCDACSICHLCESCSIE